MGADKVLRAIHLTRFRGFGDTTTLPLRPLTVLLGPNSSGKSAFGQALVALQQTHHRAAAEPRLDEEQTGGELRTIDVGNRESLRTSGKAGDVSIGVTLGTGPGKGSIEFGFGGIDAVDSLDLTRIRIVDGDAANVQARFESEAYVSVPTDFEVEMGNLSPSEEPGVTTLELTRRDRSTWDSDQGMSGGVALAGLRLKHHWHDTGTVAPVVSRVQESFLEMLSKMRYLKPNRVDPWRRRAQERSRSVGNYVGPDGRWTADMLIQYGDRQMSFPRPPKLPSTPEEAERLMGTAWTTEASSLANLVIEWMAHLELASTVSAFVDKDDWVRLEAAVADRAPFRPLTDVGFGLSQVLPVIVQGLLLDADALFVVEQPESQLHPRSQARLADFFCALAKAGRMALVECHSEAFFGRLRTRALMDPALQEMIAVHFLDACRGDGCEDPKPVLLSDDRPIPWPRGFLADAVDEELALSAIRAAMRRRAT